MKFRTFMSQWITPVLIIALIGSIIVTTSRAHDDPCDYYEKVKVHWEMKEFEHEMELTRLEDKGYLGAASEGAWAGMIGGGAGGAAAGIAAGGVGAVPAAGAGAVAGGVGGTIAGLWAHRQAIKSLKKEIKFAREMLKIIKLKLKKCRESYAIIPEDPQGTLEPYMNSPTELQSGETHYAEFSSNVPFSTIYWYVRAPGESGLGTNITTDSGDGSKTSSTFSYTPNAIGNFTITAYTYFGNTIIEPSYYISVSH